MRKLILATLVALTPFAAHASGYYVYCANSKIEVDSRDFAQMKSARGSGICRSARSATSPTPRASPRRISAASAASARAVSPYLPRRGRCPKGGWGCR